MRGVSRARERPGESDAAPACAKHGCGSRAHVRRGRKARTRKRDRERKREGARGPREREKEWDQSPRCRTRRVSVTERRP